MSKFIASAQTLSTLATLAACVASTSFLAPSAFALSTRDRVVESVPFANSPQGREVQIQGLDLIESQMENMGVTMNRQRLDVYVWVRGPSQAKRTDVRIIDTVRSPVSSPYFGNGTSGDAILVGADSHHSGYSIYRVSFSLADGGANKSEKFCVHLSASLKGGAPAADTVFNYCK